MKAIMIKALVLSCLTTSSALANLCEVSVYTEEKGYASLVMDLSKNTETFAKIQTMLENEGYTQWSAGSDNVYLVEDVTANKPQLGVYLEIMDNMGNQAYKLGFSSSISSEDPLLTVHSKNGDCSIEGIVPRKLVSVFEKNLGAVEGLKAEVITRGYGEFVQYSLDNVVTCNQFLTGHASCSNAL